MSLRFLQTDFGRGINVFEASIYLGRIHVFQPDGIQTHDVDIILEVREFLKDQTCTNPEQLKFLLSEMKWSARNGQSYRIVFEEKKDERPDLIKSFAHCIANVSKKWPNQIIFKFGPAQSGFYCTIVCPRRQDCRAFAKEFLVACGTAVFINLNPDPSAHTILPTSVMQQEIKVLLKAVMLKAYELLGTLSWQGIDDEARAKYLVDLAMVPTTLAPDLTSDDYGNPDDLEDAVFQNQEIGLGGMSDFSWSDVEEPTSTVTVSEAARQGVSAPPGGWDVCAGGAVPSVPPGTATTPGLSGSMASEWPPVAGSALGKRSKRNW